MPYLSLIIERDARLSQSIQRDFPAFGFKPYVVESCETAMTVMRQWSFDAVVLDADAIGPGVLPMLRRLQLRSHIPLMLLSTARDEQEQIASLESGATEIVTMPASTRLIAAKLRRLIEVGVREPEDEASEITVGPLVMHARRGRATVNGVPLELTTHQFELLFVLASRAGQFVHRETIARALRGPMTEVGRSADVHIYRIRKKLRDQGIASLRLDTVYGRGYCLSVHDPQRQSEDVPVRYPQWVE
ncbi:response regulator transcription factor [Piscinibacter terrae]|uniref:DNA-binding response regulator n=1 Tax=Piscinibacter terrae TaxID=2496871 RepID=A0A3N7HVP2_9BURK|nr:response regulator transcription factor [Albitalea terrae]RQP25913.1 DNA-binding response regulator [Albitalea terrae]